LLVFRILYLWSSDVPLLSTFKRKGKGKRKKLNVVYIRHIFITVNINL